MYLDEDMMDGCCVLAVDCVKVKVMVLSGLLRSDGPLTEPDEGNTLSQPSQSKCMVSANNGLATGVRGN